MQVVIITLLWILFAQGPVRTVSAYFLLLVVNIVAGCLTNFVFGRIYKTEASKQEYAGPNK